MDIERRYALGSEAVNPSRTCGAPGRAGAPRRPAPGSRRRCPRQSQGPARQAGYGLATSSVSSLPDVAAASMSVALTWANGPATSARVHVCLGRLPRGFDGRRRRQRRGRPLGCRTGPARPRRCYSAASPHRLRTRRRNSHRRHRSELQFPRASHEQHPRRRHASSARIGGEPARRSATSTAEALQLVSPRTDSLSPI